MEFKPLYFGDRLHIINPHGVIGVVTLWSRPEFVIERFREAGVDLDPNTSPIAVFGTLYGNGLREMLRNLLYNPQIQVLLICGHDRSGSAFELQSFFQGNLEPAECTLSCYKPPEGIERVGILRLADTQRLIDDLVKPDKFKFYPELPRIVSLPDPQKDGAAAGIREFFAGFVHQPRLVGEEDRRAIPLPEVEVQYFPSNPLGHQIVAERPLDAWVELLFRLTRFGRPVALAKGERIELQNVKVVVEKPERESLQRIAWLNLDQKKLLDYFKNFLKGELRADETYNYGHRLRRYFDLDAVEVLAARLQNDPEDRKAYFTLWDNRRDLTARESRPCFVSVFFRKLADKLALTATFRTHNAMDAWLMNLYGLMALQGEVAKRAGMAPGPITVFSHSISVDPRELDRALAVVAKRKWKMHLDPQGYFRVTLDGDEILAEHRFGDVTLKEYRGRTAVAVQHQIARDLAISDINHGMYLGRQLAKAEAALKEGKEFVQD
ncbi:MAG: thymidylate synthase [Deltaproteobacteria bacterium]|nr:thymidylate synthase [Deltaproteobacteria bacterium]